MKMAVIADIHGNITALKATLKDIQSQGCKSIICLGDIAGKGRYVNECLDLLRAHCDVILMGNNDEEIIDTSLLIPEHNEYMKQLPYCHELWLSGRLVRMFHAGPDSVYNYRNTNPIASIEERYQMFEPNRLTLTREKADVVIYGHVHVQTMVKFYNRTLVCCGSVGNNLDFVRHGERDGDCLNTTCATYVIIEGTLNSHTHDDFSIQFMHVPYDIDEELTLQQITSQNHPLYKELKTGRYRNPKKIRGWLPRDCMIED